jgi:hypothetical protein
MLAGGIGSARSFAVVEIPFCGPATARGRRTVARNKFSVVAVLERLAVAAALIGNVTAAAAIIAAATGSTGALGADICAAVSDFDALIIAPATCFSILAATDTSAAIGTSVSA